MFFIPPIPYNELVRISYTFAVVVALLSTVLYWMEKEVLI
jgi:hypothetical protein